MTETQPSYQSEQSNSVLPPTPATPNRNKKNDITLPVLFLVIGMLMYLFYRANTATTTQELPVVTTPSQNNRLQGQPASPTPLDTSLPAKQIGPTLEELTNARNQSSVLKVGNFTFALPPRYISPVEVDGYYYEGFNAEPKTVSTSKIEVGSTSNCAKINGVHWFAAETYYPSDSINAPWLSMHTWNENDINFKDQHGNEIENFKLEHESYLQGLSLLNSYSEKQNVFQEVLKNGNLLDKPPIYCAGGWHYPLLVTKIEQSKFDSIYYVEVNSGNGDLEGPPDRSLYIHDGEDWLIVIESQPYDKNQDWSECYPLEYDNNEKLKCVERVWREKYRNEAENQVWIARMIEMISKP